MKPEKNLEPEAQKQEAPSPSSAMGLSSDCCPAEQAYSAKKHLAFRFEHEIESLIRRLQRVQDLKRNVEFMSEQDCHVAIQIQEIFHS